MNGYFEFMGHKICDITDENYEVVKILKTAVQNLLADKSERRREVINNLDRLFIYGSELNTTEARMLHNSIL